MDPKILPQGVRERKGALNEPPRRTIDDHGRQQRQDRKSLQDRLIRASFGLTFLKQTWSARQEVLMKLLVSHMSRLRMWLR